MVAIVIFVCYVLYNFCEIYAEQVPLPEDVAQLAIISSMHVEVLRNCTMMMMLIKWLRNI